MKTILFKSILVKAFLFMFICIEAQTSNFNFNIPNDLCFTITPAQTRLINFNVTLLRNECINMFGANPNVDARRLATGNNRMARAARSSTIAIARLESVSTVDGNKVYNFGPSCGEAAVDDANVTIAYSGNAADSDKFSGGRTPFRLNIGSDEILTVTGNGTSVGTKSEDYLRVNASPRMTATISIANNANQGQVIIGIFKSDGNPNPIALLDPKSAENLTFTVNKSVFVVPLIRPKFKIINGRNAIVFEVGDPVENGTIIVEEDE